MPSGVNRAKKREFREREEITCKMHELHYPSPSCVHPSSPPLLPGVPSTSPVICPLLLSPWWKLKYSLITGDTEAQPLAALRSHAGRQIVFPCVCLYVWANSSSAGLLCLLCGISSQDKDLWIGFFSLCLPPLLILSLTGVVSLSSPHN